MTVSDKGYGMTVSDERIKMKSLGNFVFEIPDVPLLSNVYAEVHGFSFP